MKNIPYFDLFYLKLGNKCNFNCKHCSQGTVPRTDESDEISPDVIQFLDNYIEKYKDRKKSIVRLWGGEPLLYFDFIKQLVKRYKNNFEYTFISNGSLLNEEIVEFINDNDIKFVLSNDGKPTKDIRGIDVLKNEKIKNLFEKIKNKSFMSVITALNPRIDETIDYFRKMNYEDIYIYFVWLVNHDGTKDQDILSRIDFNEYKKGCEIAYDRYELHRKGQGYFPKEHNFISSFLSRIKYPKKKMLDDKNTYIKKCSTCGYYIGNKMIEMDVRGNIYECHNGNNIVGTIKDEYSDVEEKVKKIKDQKTKDLDCRKCPIVDYCEGVCPNSTSLGSETWCNFSKATFSTIIKKAFNIEIF